MNECTDYFAAGASTFFNAMGDINRDSNTEELEILKKYLNCPIKKLDQFGLEYYAIRDSNIVSEIRKFAKDLKDDKKRMSILNKTLPDGASGFVLRMFYYLFDLSQ
jgi:Na+-translocating ferredoxin:NAD+ oxidoreductase RnfG subunit